MNQTPIMPRSHLQSFVLPGRHANRILREGLEVTIGHHAEAMILRKFIHWTGRLWDFDQFMHEESTRGKQEFQDDPPESGWVEKTADDILSESIPSLSRHAIRKHLKSLVRKEFLYEREDPVYQWEHALQYRVNLIRLRKALARRGYHLDERDFS
ncbi:MAG: hypothetical protein QME27_01830 [Syntrophaceae bacterium]|nr:hypothetical protein [Syntrophaceae bacterium]